jgi:hypothetical protein
MVAPGLQHHADLGPPLLVPVRGVHTEDADLAGRPPAETLENLDGGALTGTVRPEQGEHLAALRGE